MKKSNYKSKILILMLSLHSIVSLGQIFNGKSQLSNDAKVKSITSSRFWINEVEKFGELIIQKELSFTTSYVFDEEGREIINIMYDDNGKIERKQVLKYNDEGQQVETINYNSDGSKDIYKKFYNETGYYIKATQFDNKSKVWKIARTMKYDSKGNKIETISYTNDGSIRNKWTSEYDDYGNLVEDNSYNSFGELTGKDKFKYDDVGNRITSFEYNPNGTLDRKYSYKYNKDGNKIERREYNSFKALINKIKYDDYGNQTHIIRYDKGLSFYEEKITFSYEYDSNNNWIKETEVTKTTSYRNTKYITERIIDYYQ